MRRSPPNVERPARLQWSSDRRTPRFGRSLSRGIDLLGAIATLVVFSGVAPAMAQAAYFNRPSYFYLPAPAPPQAPDFGQAQAGGARRPEAGFRAEDLGESARGGGAVRRQWRPLRLVRRRLDRTRSVNGDEAAYFTEQTLAQTRRAADRYARIVDAGGWPVVPASLRPGSRGRAVAILKRRLAIEGDLNSSAARETYDYRSADERWDRQLTAAVKRFQARLGLPRNGIVAGQTLKAINVSARTRLRELRATAARLASINFPFGRRYVEVNIPSQTVEAVQNGRVVRRYEAIVGSPEHRSPQIVAQAVEINLNPTWTVPESIIKKEMIPEMRRDPNYLRREHIRVLDFQGHEINPRSINWNSDEALHYMLRQDSGPYDALGRLRIDMPNNQAVYMHDTPEKWLFNASYRFKSHGCVRIKDVNDLAAWLLQGTPRGRYDRWSAKALEAGIATSEQHTIKLARPIPVVWVYMTGWADAEGVVHFRNDVYGEDTAGGTLNAALR